MQSFGHPEPEPFGVTRARARERAARLSAVTCEVYLRIPRDRRDGIDATTTVAFTLMDTQGPVVFDFRQPSDRLLRSIVNGRQARLVVEQGHIIVPALLLYAGRNIVQFDVVAGDDALNRGEDSLYSLFVPARASWTFPCFDQPDIRVRWRVTLEVPHDWVAVSNGRNRDRVQAGNRVTYRFEDTQPLPTYLLAIAAGRFSITDVAAQSRHVRLFHEESDGDRVARNRDAIVNQHVQALDWMEAYTAIPYPFDSYDIILIPSFQFSGMEHPGAVYYNADAVLLDAAAPRHHHLNRATLIAHETAHMWFGNLVTMRWFDDVWIKEVFASLLAEQIVAPLFPDMAHDVRFLVQHYPPAYAVDRSAGTHPVRQSLDNLDKAGLMYGALAYHKAPIAFRQLEMRMGASRFRAALREYLATFAMGHASWNQLVAVLDRHTDHDVSRWARVWIEESGRPTLTTKIHEGRDATTVTLQQRDRLGRRLTWPQQVDVLLGHGQDVRTVEMVSDAAEVGVEVPRRSFRASWALPGGLAYGEVDPDDRTLAMLLDVPRSVPDARTRAAMFITRWEATLAGRIAPARVFDALLSDVSVESHELLRPLLLSQIHTVFWRLTRASDRLDAAAPLDAVLRRAFDKASIASKAAWFTIIRQTALLPSTVTWLADIWARRISVPDLALSEIDEADLAADLALRMPADSASILSVQIARLGNTDRQRRLAHSAPALSPDPAVRREFFHTLRPDDGRIPETWILEALRYLHHPLREDRSPDLVIPSLQRVWAVQRAGDIFFPLRWIEATLSGCQSAPVAAAVRAFIASLPEDYPKQLRSTMLSAGDLLFRAAAILEGWTAEDAS